MNSKSYDSIVVGGGSGGLAFAQTAAALGARILLIEQADLGGTCVNRGCVPKKILWSAGQLRRSIVAANRAGVLKQTDVDFGTLALRRDAHIADLRDGFEKTLTERGIDLVRGTAEVDGRQVRVGATHFSAQNVVLATGARPTQLTIDGSEHLSDSSDVLSWTKVPDRIAIVGGGYIGCEFAAIFAALGSDVTLIHNKARILDAFPQALARHVQSNLTQSGICLRMEQGISSISCTEAGLEYTLSEGGCGQADAIVAAIGRTPNADRLGPISDQLNLAENGSVQVDASLATNIDGVYALGDLANRLPLTPVATADGTQLANNLHGCGGQLRDLENVATTAFVYPPAAYVGDVDNPAARSGTFRPLSADILTQAEGPDPALYRIGTDPQGCLTGAQIVADHAEDMIALLAALRISGAKLSELDKVVPVHPSFVEEFLEN